MVSIPDWSRFRGLTEPRKPTASPGAKFNKQREEEAIKLAVDSGYFLTATRSFLQDKFLAEDAEAANRRQRLYFDYVDEDERDLNLVKMVKLPGAHLRGVGDIGLCTQLRICVLANNYIQRFDALVSCVNLFKLDLHSNQIAMLPGADFWGGMRLLRVLNLHDNPLGKIENLHCLSAAAQLQVVTLYDTPLSLKRNYRHHVVNSLWSLKALDNFVISDEEIIEDADFRGKFSARHPAFAINLCPPNPTDAGFDEELQNVFDVIARVNKIMAHGSPVLIIQRHIRGMLLRKRYKLVQDMRIWAAVTIQRRYRDWKGIETPRTNVPPPPSSPILATLLAETKNIPAGPPPSMSGAEKLDYDTYMQHRRPGSTGLSENSFPARVEQDGLPPGVKQIETCAVPTPVSSAGSDGHRRKNIFINLAKLQAGTLQSLQDESFAMETMFAPTSDGATMSLERPRRDTKSHPRSKREMEVKKKKVKDIKQFFGPVVNPPSSPEPVSPLPHHDDEDIPLVSFRLRGKRQGIVYFDPTTDMLLSRHEAGVEVRQAQDDIHRMELERDKPIVTQKKTLTNEQRMFSRMQGTMGLSCLHAIQHAYRDREHAEHRAARLEFVLNQKEQRDTAKQRVKIYQDEKRRRALKQRERDHRRILDNVEKLEMKRQNTFEHYHEIRNRSSTYQKQRKGELTFISDFNVQNTSVSNALLRHDRQARLEDRQGNLQENVEQQHSSEKEQQNVVTKYLEHRQLMRQTETAMSRAALDTRMLQEANDRLIESKGRVEQQKARKDRVNNFYPMPSLSAQSLPPITDDQVKAMQGLDRWNTQLMTTQGRVGRHPTEIPTT